MELLKFIKNKGRGYQSQLAKEVGISQAFMWQIANKRRKSPPQVAKDIELATNFKVTKKELRPDIWVD